MGFSLFQMLKKLKNLFLKQKYFNCNKVIKKFFLHKSNCPAHWNCYYYYYYSFKWHHRFSTHALRCELLRVYVGIKFNHKINFCIAPAQRISTMMYVYTTVVNPFYSSSIYILYIDNHHFRIKNFSRLRRERATFDKLM